MVLFWGLVALEVFMEIASPQALLAMPALVATFIGLLGLYPNLTDNSPRLARAGLGILTVAGVGLIVIFAWVLVGNILQMVAGMEVPTKPPGIVIAATVGGYVMTVLLFGIASLRNADPSRTVGYLLLGLVGAFTIPVIAGVIWGGYPGEWMAVVVSGLQAAVIIAIGYSLRTGPSQSHHNEPPIDSTA